MMRWFLVAGLVVPAFPAQASAQAMMREGIIGTWVGEAKYTSEKRQRMGGPMEDTVRATFYADGLMKFEDGYTHGSGRWRLSGDTLWWGTDARYGNGMLYNKRGELPEGPVADTLEWAEFPANDSLFWTASKEERRADYWHLTAYKLSSRGEQLSMVRIDNLSNDTWDPATGVYKRRKKSEPMSCGSGFSPKCPDGVSPAR